MSSRVSRESIVASQLADPTTRCRIDFNQEIDWAAVLAILVGNKVPLIGLTLDPALTDCPLLRVAEFQRIAAEEHGTWQSFRDHYGTARDRFLRRGIQSVLLKSAGLSPSFPYTSDNLDTLVRPEHIQSCREILGELGFVELRNIEEPLKFLFRKFEGGESVSAIHLHGTVGWGVPFLDDAALWKRVRVSEDDPLVLVPASEDALLVTIAHAFYEDKSFKILDIARIRHCLRRGNLDFPDVERIARRRGWEDGLAFCLALYSRLEDWLYGEQSIPGDALERARSVVRSNAWLSQQLENALRRDEVHFPFRLSFLFGKLLYYRKILNDPQRNPATRTGDVIRTLAWGIKLKLHIRGQRGLIVSFSGIDGSGKTVHIRALGNACAIAEVKARSFWTRFGSSARKSDLGRPGSKNARISDTATSLARRRRRLRHRAMRLGWLMYNLTLLVLRYNWHVRLRRWLGEVVICDRYVYDAAVEINVSLPDDPGLCRWAERLLIHLSPRPEVAWLLDVPADISVERQTDENRSIASREELSRQRSVYRALAGTYGLKLVETCSRPEETTSHVVRETLRAYYDDYKTCVNALLLSNPNQMNPRKGAR
jgi:thymidylate kinase